MGTLRSQCTTNGKARKASVTSTIVDTIELQNDASRFGADSTNSPRTLLVVRDDENKQSHHEQKLTDQRNAVWVFDSRLVDD